MTFSAAATENPEWGPWLRLLERAQDAAGEPWRVEIGLAANREVRAPLLHEARLALEGARVREWLDTMLRAAAAELKGRAELGSMQLDEANALRLLEAAIGLDEPMLERLAEARGAATAPLAAVLQLATMPILRACRRRLAAEVPQGWPYGHCPVCAAWPALAETRGLERERRVRCGRCSCDWKFGLLHCPFCDERDHKQLAGFVVEGNEEMRRVDTCRSCHGYLKGVATLMALPDERVAVLDVETLELDLVAADRGFSRPAQRAFPMRIGLTSGPADTTDGDREWLLS
ncbi:MAG TPA: formate dehydrogenase accessory protein FdhE [Gemmatimonadaceae bacterium]|nr:formate dehydrogenase accessory protein FdhE [Gemmatimonadaceae bacterium]